MNIEQKTYNDLQNKEMFKSPSRECQQTNYDLISDSSRTTTAVEEMDSPETLSAKKKSFEAFVMTGDRMINLAKTPANNEFKSKHLKALDPIPLLDDVSASVPSSPPQKIPSTNEYGLNDSSVNKEQVEYSDQMDQSGSDSNVVRLRQQPQRNRSAVR